jgi:hypothetical protein
MIQQGPINLIGWLLVGAAAVGIAASGVGIFLLFTRPDASLAHNATELYLHDTYYLISRPYSAMWPLILCIVLSIAIGIIGYMHTDHLLNRRIQIDLQHEQSGTIEIEE